MHADHAGRIGNVRLQPGDRDPRGVGGNDRISGDHAVDLAVDVGLYRLFLWHVFDDQIGAAHGILEFAGETNRPGTLRLDPEIVENAVGGRQHRARPLDCFGRDIVGNDLKTAARKTGSHAGPHRT